jgi:hypothetical protein
LIRDAYRRLCDEQSRGQVLASIGRASPAPRAIPTPAVMRSTPPHGVPTRPAGQKIPSAQVPPITRVPDKTVPIPAQTQSVPTTRMHEQIAPKKPEPLPARDQGNESVTKRPSGTTPPPQRTVTASPQPPVPSFDGGEHGALEEMLDQDRNVAGAVAHRRQVHLEDRERLVVGARDRSVGGVYAPPVVRRELAGDVYVQWRDGRVSSASVGSIFLRDPAASLPRLRARAYAERFPADLPEDKELPAVRIHDPALARVAAGGTKCAYVVAEEGFRDEDNPGRDDLCSRFARIAQRRGDPRQLLIAVGARHRKKIGQAGHGRFGFGAPTDWSEHQSLSPAPHRSDSVIGRVGWRVSCGTTAASSFSP